MKIIRALYNFFQKIASWISYKWFIHLSKKIRSPYNHIIPNLLGEQLKTYDNCCSLSKQKEIDITTYTEWRKVIFDLLRKNDDRTDLINYAHYLQLLARNYEATKSIPAHLIEFILGLVLGAFFTVERLLKIDNSPIWIAIAIICFILLITMCFSSTSRRPSDFCSDVKELVEERIKELETHTYDLSQNIKYNELKEAYNAAVIEKKCILLAEPKDSNEEQKYVLFPNNEWQNMKFAQIIDNGYTYREFFKFDEITSVERAKRFDTEELAIKEFVMIDDIEKRIYKDEKNNKYFIYNNSPQICKVYQPADEASDTAIGLIFDKHFNQPIEVIR